MSGFTSMYHALRKQGYSDAEARKRVKKHFAKK